MPPQLLCNDEPMFALAITRIRKKVGGRHTPRCPLQERFRIHQRQQLPDMLPGTEATGACRFHRTRAQGLLSPWLLHPLTLLASKIDVLVIARSTAKGQGRPHEILTAARRRRPARPAGRWSAARGRRATAAEVRPFEGRRVEAVRPNLLRDPSEPGRRQRRPAPALRR